MHDCPCNHPLRWRHNGRDGVSNHQPHHCLLNRLFMRGSKKTSKLRVAGLCEENSPATGEFPAQMASNAENVSIWWRHHIHKGWIIYVNYKTTTKQSKTKPWQCQNLGIIYTAPTSDNLLLRFTVISMFTGHLFKINLHLPSPVLLSGYPNIGSFEIHWVKQYLVSFTGLADIINATVYKTELIFTGLWYGKWSWFLTLPWVYSMVYILRSITAPDSTFWILVVFWTNNLWKLKTSLRWIPNPLKIMIIIIIYFMKSYHT